MNIGDIRHIEFDLTAKCNASCPQCSRTKISFDNIYNKNEITALLVKQWLPKEVLINLELISFKGTFSEPVLAFINNTTANISIHTNGSLKKPDWWANLAVITKKRTKVIFGIDGLEDTHHIYRINTSFSKIIENATAFISAGGDAIWQFICFKHNEHQINDAKQMSEVLGFSKFFILNNDRFVDEKTFLTKKGNELAKSQFDNSLTYNDFRNEIKKNFKEIVCKSKTQGWLLIDWDGDVFPCCYSQVWKDKYNPYPLDKQIWNKAKAEISNNLFENSLENIIEISNNLFELHDKNRIPVVCSKYCNKN